MAPEVIRLKNRYCYCCLFVLLLLGGCAGLQIQAPSDTQPAGESAIFEAVPNYTMTENRAVIALLDQAQSDNMSGQREAAGASLERALRIEPRNPWLWLELAQLRLDQGQYAQAITLARKSNSFAGRLPRVQAGNWQVIGQARAAQGDPSGAEQAFKLAAELAQQAKENQDSLFNFQ